MQLLVVALLLMPAGASALPFILERTFEVPGVTRIDGLTYNTATDELIAVNAEFTDTLYVIGLDGTLHSTHNLDFTEGSRSLAYNPLSDSLFIGEFGVGSIYEATLYGDLIRSFDAPLYTNDGLTFHSSTGTLFTNAGGTSGMIFQLDPLTGAALNSFPQPSNYGSGMASDGMDLFYHDASIQTIFTLDAWTGSVLDSFVVDIPSAGTGLAFGGGHLYAWNESESRIEVFSIVPEPGTAAMLGPGLVGLVLVARRRRPRE